MENEKIEEPLETAIKNALEYDSNTYKNALGTN
jgi:hypothetical protein